MQSPSLLPVSVQALGDQEEKHWDAECKLQAPVLWPNSKGEDVGQDDEGHLEGFEYGRELERERH